MIKFAPEVFAQDHICPGSFLKVKFAPEVYKVDHICPFPSKYQRSTSGQREVFNGKRQI